MKKVWTGFALTVSMLGVQACSSAQKTTTLLGAGSTFVYPLFSKMFSEYQSSHGTKVNYQAIGSGGGIRQLINHTVDFGATDAFMSDEELQQAGGAILHIPICLGAVVLSYNLPQAPPLRLTPEVIADIFLGNITNWNDPRIAEVNPGIFLPDLEITVIHRSDGSGTTYIFSDYLSKVSPEWAKRVGRGKSLNWPVGLGAKGNPGVAGLIQQTPGAIGYIELTYALQMGIPFATVQNASGKFIHPSVQSVSKAAEIPIPPDTRVSLTNTDAPDGYPISGFTWVIVYQEQSYGGRSKARAEALAQLLWWMIHEGQSYTQPLNYAPLPESAVKAAETLLRSLTYQGQPLLPG